MKLDRRKRASGSRGFPAAYLKPTITHPFGEVEHEVNPSDEQEFVLMRKQSVTADLVSGAASRVAADIALHYAPFGPDGFLGLQDHLTADHDLPFVLTIDSGEDDFADLYTVLSARGVDGGIDLSDLDRYCIDDAIDGGFEIL